MGKILIIDDEISIREALKRYYLMHGFDIITFENAEIAWEYIEKNHENIDMVLTDLVMEGKIDGKQLFYKVKDKYPFIPVIVMSGRATVEDAITLMREGVYDFFIKPFENIEKLILVSKKAIEWSTIKREYEKLKKLGEKEAVFSRIIGKSKKMHNVFEKIIQVAPTKATVLIYGETGTGKELIAEAIHERSGRKGQLIKVNCAALTETLLESELFGHEKGAFTGAIKTKYGRFELADKGTIFLDEIAEISPKIQVKLLRVLQNKTFERVGGEKTISVDVRVISATNKDLSELVRQGKFREDLYWRLNVVQINVPPLRERKEDIPLLVRYFIDKYSKENNIEIDGISPKALKILLKYNWPGNVRELENCIENMIVLSRKDKNYLDVEDIPIYIIEQLKDTTLLNIPENENKSSDYIKFQFGLTLEEVEKQYILFILKKVKNKSKAAEILGIRRKTLYNKLKTYNLPLNIEELPEN